MTSLSEKWDVLVGGWAALADPQAYGLTSTRKWNAVADRIAKTENEVFADPGGLQFILKKLATGNLPDPLRQQLFTMFDVGYSPIHEADQFRADPRIGLTDEQLPLVPYLPLTAVPNVPGDGTPAWRSEGQSLADGRILSRFGGHPTAGEGHTWPECESNAYTFIAQVDFSLVREDIPDAREMPLAPQGIMQLFINIDTIGSSRIADAMLRFIGEDSVAPYADESGPSLMDIVPADVGIAASTGPPPEELSEHELDRFLFARSVIAAAAVDPGLRGVTYPGAEPFLPLSGVGGLGHHRLDDDLIDQLTELLSLGADDRHVLALELIGPRDLRGTPLERLDLQVRIRESDFVAGRFGEAVVLLLPPSTGQLGVTEARHA